MAEQRKAIIIATGMDNLQLLATLKDTEVATGASLERIKGLYTKFSEQQAALESAKNDQSLARLKANDDLKLAEMERFFSAQRAMYEENAAVAAIGGGSVPENMASGATATAGGLAIGRGVKAVEHEAGPLARIFRETTVLFREGLRGNFTRMIGSFTILIGAIGSLAAIVAAGTAAIVALPAWRAWQAIKGERGGAADLKESERIEGGNLEKRIDMLKRAGFIDAKQAQEFEDQLKRGDVMGVLGATNKFMPTGGTDALAGWANREDALRYFQNKMNQANETGMTPHQRYNADTMNLARIQGELAQLPENSDAWLAKRKEWADAYLQQQKDIKDIQEQTAKDKKESLEKEKEKEKELADLNREKGNLAIQMAADEQKQSEQFGTARQIAQFGWSYSPRYGWQRTEAGGMAHELEQLEGGNGHLGWQTWNRLHGNIALANQQAAREAYLKRTLGDMGYLPKDEHWAEMVNHLQNLNQQIASVTDGNTLAVTIDDVK
jgi:hypothetical protein